jgi:XTP/dITP diphosphohydrolase
MKKIIIASHNPGKLREITHILDPLGLEAVPQADFGVPEAEEPHVTFIENCIVKARHASAHTGLPALADDSGICVEALNGAPGVYSARYAGEPKSDERNNQKLVDSLRGEKNRKAHYYCVIVFVRYPDDPQPIIAEGIWRGEILEKPSGTGGFGYDPYFRIPGLDKTAAELSMDVKNQLSHRGQALRAFAEKLSAEMVASRTEAD